MAAWLHSCCVSCQRTLAPSLSPSHAQSLAHSQGLDLRERGPADELPPLAAGALASAACLVSHSATSTVPSTADSSSSSSASATAQHAASAAAAAAAHLLRAALALEAAAARRPHAAAARLSLGALYCLLGVPDQAVQHLKSLDLKHIQLDSLAGHHLLPPLLAYGAAAPPPPEGAEAATPGSAAGGAAAGAAVGLRVLFT